MVLVIESKALCMVVKSLAHGHESLMRLLLVLNWGKGSELEGKWKNHPQGSVWESLLQ